MATDFKLTLISRDLAVIKAADAAGIDRIGIDIERLGKRERQGHLGTRISDHELEDLRVVAANVKHADVFIRVNPLHSGTRAEVERAIVLGATVMMLPYFTTAREVAAYVDMVAGRATVVLLLETAAAAARLHELVAVPGIAEILVGLNDLHLSMKLASHFEILASDLMIAIARVVRDAGLEFGFGGLGRPGDTALPVPPELVYAQYPRLAARSAWIARSFFSTATRPLDIGAEIARVRAELDHWFAQPPAVLAEKHEELRRLVRSLVGRSAS